MRRSAFSSKIGFFHCFVWYRSNKLNSKFKVVKFSYKKNYNIRDFHNLVRSRLAYVNNLKNLNIAYKNLGVAFDNFFFTLLNLLRVQIEWQLLFYSLPCFSLFCCGILHSYFEFFQRKSLFVDCKIEVAFD